MMARWGYLDTVRERVARINAPHTPKRLNFSWLRGSRDWFRSHRDDRHRLRALASNLLVRLSDWL